MSFAVIKTGGKQYIVEKGDTITIEKLPKRGSDNEITFNQVLLIDNGKKTEVGTPYIKGAAVSATFIEEGKGKKIIVLKYKPKTRYRIKRGHRQEYTKVKIKNIIKK